MDGPRPTLRPVDPRIGDFGKCLTKPLSVVITTAANRLAVEITASRMVRPDPSDAIGEGRLISVQSKTWVRAQLIRTAHGTRGQQSLNRQTAVPGPERRARARTESTGTMQAEIGCR